MKTKLAIFLVIFSRLFCQAQSDTLKEVKLEMLKTPTNSAFIVMGTTPCEIVQPASAPEFVVAIQNASNSFSSFPNNFGFSVTPFWWTNGKQLSFNRDFDTANTLRLYRHLRFSGGVLAGVDNDQKEWRYGLGVETTILQGKVMPKARAAYFKVLTAVSHSLNDELNKLRNEDPALQMLYAKKSEYLLEKQKYDATNPFGSGLEPLDSVRYLQLKKLVRQTDSAIEERTQLFKDVKLPLNAELEKSLEKAFQAMNIRYGWKWNFGAAAAYNLQDNRLDSSSLYRSGLWSNFGYSFKGSEKCQFSMLGAARYYYYHQVFYQQESGGVVLNKLGVVDAGLRLVLDAQKLSFSLEGLYRYGLKQAFESTYKLNAFLNYHFSENRMIYFSVGNDFNDTSVGEPKQLKVYIGINLGLGDATDIKYQLK